MFTDDKSIENIRQLFLELKKYVLLQKEYTKLEMTEKLSILLSRLILILLVVILSMMALFYLSFTLAYLLVPLVGSLIASFSIIAGIHIVLIVILLTFRKAFIINPMVKFLATLFLTKPTNKSTPHE